ncbi:MAG: hypothetical protein M9941_08730 [Anaerolineae bacterium]|nr:hypothetical protein [Anaerolineae bacterium]MCO5192677.1 hypothetical protein [Anaerolineae bacterium]MCO5197811.1 hypothetical protein [Anaerolineae bacterium]
MVSGTVISLSDRFPGLIDDHRFHQEWIALLHDNSDWWPDPYAELVAYNVETEEQVLIAPYDREALYYIWAIDNGRVLWSRQTEACELDLYLYDLNTRQDIRLTDDCEAQIEVSADIGGDWVVWKGYLTEDIHALNLATDEHRRITNTLYTESFPYTDGQRIIWEQNDSNPDNWDVYRYDLETGETFPVAVGPENEYTVTIDGKWLHWHNWGQATAYAKNLETNEEIAVFTYPEDLIPYVPFAEGNKVAWGIREDGIYLATLLEMHMSLPVVLHSE